MKTSTKLFLPFILLSLQFVIAQPIEIELDEHWLAKRCTDVAVDGTILTSQAYQCKGWLDAIVPGTILTTLLHNNQIPDPFFGFNNEYIPDVYDTGRDYYSYWFYNQFELPEIKENQQVWLKFRGINYFADIFLNGQRINKDHHVGMFLREKYLISDHVKIKEYNRLAVLVEPPDPVGNPARGQGGDGVIGRSVSQQFTAGWDWICPIRDRNTGIWDKVHIEITGPVDLRDPYIKPRVEGRRHPREKQDPAYFIASCKLVNATDQDQNGTLQIRFQGEEWQKRFNLKSRQHSEVFFDEVTVKDPKLWWPNGMGQQPLYNIEFKVLLEDNTISDLSEVSFGLRQTGSYFDAQLGARIFLINGQKVFIKGGNWIASDALLRLSKERYQAEVRMHADMNMNMIRIWGGSITERPEFYQACDRYGIMVWQDFWVTGDCNGRWLDPIKKESQARRRAYPDDHTLFLKSAEDQIKMLRNHPSLYLWCGGNEYPPPKDIDNALEKEIIPRLDGTRLYLNESTSESLSINTIGGNGDGPYRIQDPAWYFSFKSYPFNPEIGSVGFPNYEYLQKILPLDQLEPPKGWGRGQSYLWYYHKFQGYSDFLEQYGEVNDLKDFCQKAQMVNYEQYRAQQEGFNNHMWQWYSGMLVWKTQNPWSALKGMFYDPSLDPTGGFFGYMHGARPLHIQLNLDDSSICVVNQTLDSFEDLQIESDIFSLHGMLIERKTDKTNLAANTIQNLTKIHFSQNNNPLFFLRLRLYDREGQLKDENVYWSSPNTKSYRSLQELKKVNLEVAIENRPDDITKVDLHNPQDETAFFIRLMIKSLQERELLLPVFYEDNYITIFPKEKKSIALDLSQIVKDSQKKKLVITGWNIIEQELEIDL